VPSRFFHNSSDLIQQYGKHVTYVAPIKKYAQTSPSVDGVSSFFIAYFITIIILLFLLFYIHSLLYKTVCMR
jgi:hypothetical protein